MAIRRGEDSLSTALPVQPAFIARLPRTSINLRALVRDMLLVFIAACIPSMLGSDNRIYTLALPAVVLGYLLSKRAYVAPIVRSLQFFMAYCAVWYTFGELRNMADAVSWAERTQLSVWRFERWVFGGELMNARLQRWLYEPGERHFWDTGLIPIYFSFFGASLLVGLIVAWRDWDRAWRYFVAKGIVLVVGLAIIAALPTTPPWMTPDSALTSQAAAPERVYRVTTILVGQGDDYVFKADGNPIAAMPSIHMATTMLILLLLWSSGRLWRGVGIAYSLSMAFLLVYYGEHYVVDELAGILLALGGWRLAVSWQTVWSPALRRRLNDATARIPVPAPAYAATANRTES